MSDTGDRARQLHREASIMHLDSGRDLRDILARVRGRALELVAQQPHLAGEDPRVLYSRLITPTTLVTYESALQRAAVAVLLVAAVERAETVDPTSGEAA